MPQQQVAMQGYHQNLWLHGPEHYLTEVGTMNMFVVFKKPDGCKSRRLYNRGSDSNSFKALELVTPPLDGMILPGITRDSVLSLARSHATGDYKLAELTKNLIINERHVTMKEVQEATKNGTLVEMFGAGRSHFTRGFKMDN